MKKSKILVIFLVIVAIGLFLVLAKYFMSQESSSIQLNQKDIECYKDTLYFIFNDANISADELNVQNVGCSQEKAYGQWEMSGTYFENNDHSKEPKPIYFQEIRGGMAASGADSYYEVCLIINNQSIISKIATGRNLDIKSSARCLWQSKLN